MDTTRDNSNDRRDPAQDAEALIASMELSVAGSCSALFNNCAAADKASVKYQQDMEALNVARAIDAGKLPTAQAGNHANHARISAAANNQQALVKRQNEDRQKREMLYIITQQIAEQNAIIAALKDELKDINADIRDLQKRTNAQKALLQDKYGEDWEEKLGLTKDKLEDKFGKDWEEKLRKGELSIDDPLILAYLHNMAMMNDKFSLRDAIEGRIKQHEQDRDRLIDAQTELTNNPDANINNMNDIEREFEASALEIRAVRENMQADKDAMAVDGTLGAEQEVNYFKAELERIRESGGSGLDILQKEQVLYSSLSQAAIQSLYRDDDMEYMLEEDYFAPLEESAALQTTPTALENVAPQPVQEPKAGF